MADGILHSLHHDHEEVLALLDRILRSNDGNRRSDLFKGLIAKLLAHAHAEQKVLYTRLEKSDDYRARRFAYQGENEHQMLEQQLQQMMRAQNKASEQWTAQLIVLLELFERHVRKEEGEAFGLTRRQYDLDALDRLGQEFLKEKQRQLSAA